MLAAAAVTGDEDDDHARDGVPTRSYDRVVRIVSWAFLLATTVIVVATGLWPANQPAILVLIALTGMFVLVVHDLLPTNALGPAKFVVEGLGGDHGRHAARGPDRRRGQPVLLRLPADRRRRRAGRDARASPWPWPGRRPAATCSRS